MKDQYLQVMISVDEKRVFDAAAEREHLTLSEWFRWVLVKTVQRSKETTRMTDHRKPEAATNPKILRAAHAFSKKLKGKGIRHALVGGLAVGAHGYQRATRDADFLIADEARHQIAGDDLGGEVEGKTITFQNVTVDLLFPHAGEDFLDNAITGAKNSHGIPVVPIEPLIYLKLTASRARDIGDIVELLKRRKINTQRVIKYLEVHRADLVEDFQALVVQAEHEED